MLHYIVESGILWLKGGNMVVVTDLEWKQTEKDLGARVMYRDIRLSGFCMIRALIVRTDTRPHYDEKLLIKASDAAEALTIIYDNYTSANIIF